MLSYKTFLRGFKAIQETLKLTSQGVLFVTTLGKLLEAHGFLDDAKNDYAKAIKLNPKHF